MDLENNIIDENYDLNNLSRIKNNLKDLYESILFLEKNPQTTEMNVEKGGEEEEKSLNLEVCFGSLENDEEQNNDDSKERFFTTQKTNDNTINKNDKKNAKI